MLCVKEWVYVMLCVKEWVCDAMCEGVGVCDAVCEGVGMFTCPLNVSHITGVFAFAATAHC